MSVSRAEKPSEERLGPTGRFIDLSVFSKDPTKREPFVVDEFLMGLEKRPALFLTDHFNSVLGMLKNLPNWADLSVELEEELGDLNLNAHMFFKHPALRRDTAPEYKRVFLNLCKKMEEQEVSLPKLI